MKDYLDELLLQLEAEYPEIFDELHGWAARRQHGDMKLELARQQRFIMRHMPTIWAKVDEHRVVKKETIRETLSHELVDEIPILYVQEKTIYHFKKPERKP